MTRTSIPNREVRVWCSDHARHDDGDWNAAVILVGRIAAALQVHPPTPPTSRPARKRPSSASAATARTASRRWRTCPRWRASSTSSSSGSWSISVPVRARTSRCSRSSSSSATRTSATSAPISRRCRRRSLKLTKIRTCRRKAPQAAAGRRCAACHLDNYAGTKAAARVAGQREDYLGKALRDYKSGVRSGGGQAAMAEVAHPLQRRRDRRARALSRLSAVGRCGLDPLRHGRA